MPRIFFTSIYFFLLLILTGCSGDAPPAREVLTVTKHDNNPVPTKCRLLFKIPVEHFFTDKKIVSDFKDNAENSDGFLLNVIYAPKSLVVKKGLIYIADQASGTIKLFSLKGEFQREIRIPRKYGPPGYFNVLDNGNIIFCNESTMKIYETDEHGNNLLADDCIPASTSLLPTDSDNYAYLKENNKLFSKKGLLTDKIDWNGNNNISYLLTDSSIAINYSCKTLELFRHDGSSIRKGELRPGNNRKDLSCFGLIGRKKDQLLVLYFNSTDPACFSALAAVNAKSLEQESIVYMEKPGEIEPRSIIWPDRGMKWPGGMVYYYCKEDGNLYGLCSDPTAIYVFYWPVSGESK
ncbi:MAG: hypothetical protein JWO09_2776 [Bacteroidetes bacterium]|nr:hypothetical protein [Bacteroidota bacterium]